MHCFVGMTHLHAGASCSDVLAVPLACSSIVQGKPNPLLSSFKLSYYTLLNLLRRVEVLPVP